MSFLTATIIAAVWFVFVAAAVPVSRVSRETRSQSQLSVAQLVDRGDGNSDRSSASGVNAGECIPVKDTNFPTLVQVNTDGQTSFKVLGFPTDCSSDNGAGRTLLAADFARTVTTNINERVPVCSFMLELEEQDVSVFFTGRGDTVYEKKVTGTGCQNLCTPSPHSMFAHSVKIISSSGVRSNNSIKIFSDEKCDSLVESNIVSETNLVDLTLQDRTGVVRSLMIVSET